MNVTKDFLLQLSLIALSIFTYHSFVSHKLTNGNNKKLVLAALSGISIIFCMSFPASLGAGERLDIRIIPLLFGTLYCGLRTGVFLSAVVILYRLYQGIDIGFYNAVLALLFTLPAILFFQSAFHRAKKDKRVIIAASLSLYSSLTGAVWFCVLRGISLENVITLVIQLIFIVLFTLFFIILNEKLSEINQLRLEVQNTGRLRMISDLTSVFAHEIRNPMQVARGFLQLLNAPDLPDKKKEYIQLSIEELDRANEIINDLLLFGKPSTSNNQRVDVGYQLRRVINIIQAYSLSQGVSIKTDIFDDCWTISNPQKLIQCLVNILKNAIESMPDGGVVWVTCCPLGDGYIEISIKDQGMGMTKEQIDRLGSPFYSLKEGGTGLGMMVSFQIIQSFQGEVRVTSEKGTGTEFSILLPKYI